MSDKERWRYGDTNPVVAAVDSGTAVEIGDLLWQDVDNAKPASEIPQGMVAPKGEVFAANFLGVAMERSRTGNTNPIRVATTGVFEFDCPSGTFELGQFMAVDHKDEKIQPALGTTRPPGLLSQQMASVNASQYAIGRVAKRVATAATSVLVDVRSTVMTGGVEGSSPSGV